MAGDVVRLLAGLRDAAPEDLVDVARFESVPLDQRELHLAEQLGGMESGKVALAHLAARDRRADGVDDDGFAHGVLLTRSPRSRRFRMVRC